ncbi:hypothetical protein ABIF65_005697 [Bradyrhizobium japonicum]
MATWGVIPKELADVAPYFSPAARVARARGLVMILKFLGIERTRLLIDDVSCEVEHILRDFHILDLIEVFPLGADLVGVTQQHTDEPLVHRFESDDVFAVGMEGLIPVVIDHPVSSITQAEIDARAAMVAERAPKVWLGK